MVEKQKILLCGDVEGKFNALFNRVEAINNKSGPYDLLICVGNFFGVNNKEFDHFRSKHKKVPVPTYILGPNKEEHAGIYPEEGSEVCPNVHYLGKRGLYTNSGGLKIAYISGTGTGEKASSGHTFDSDDVTALRDICRRGNTNFRGVDVLVTSQWPKDVMRFDSGYKLQTTINMQSDLTAWLSLQLKPRYHISGLEGVFYERPPFRSATTSDHDCPIEIATRFLGLARVGNPSKEKWLYALSLTPLEKMNIKELFQKTTDEVRCPFDLDEVESRIFKTKRKLPGSSGNQFFYDMSLDQDATQRERKGKRRRVEFDQGKCWFCLASPSVEKHLVVAVGNLVYLALAKGALVDDHFLICPIEHHQSTVSLPPAISKELRDFKEALRKFYGANGRVAVFFERNYKTSHMQIQSVPIPMRAIKELKEIFKEEALGHGFALEELENHLRLDQVVAAGSLYFALELPEGETLYVKIPARSEFPLNFGREVLASGPILNVPERSDWKECALRKEEEEEVVGRARTAFEPFDLTG